MANPKTQVRVEIIGDGSSAQKTFRDTAASADATSASFGKFGTSFAGEFAKLGGAAMLGARAASVVLDTLHELGQAVADYNGKMQNAQATILGVTHDQTKLTDAFAFAESELKAGRSAYSETVAAIAELTPTARRTGNDVTALYRTLQLLATLNSGPGGGTEGALVAINNALAGQFTSLQERFNLPIAGIQAAVKAGVPALQAINDALAKEGVTMDLVNAKAATFANQQAIAKDQAARLAAEVGKPIFQALAQGLTQVNEKLSSGQWAQYAEEYQHFVALLVKSLTDWKALSGVGEQLGIQIEKGLRDTLLGGANLAQDFVGGIAQSFGVKADVIARARGMNPLTKLYDAWTQKIDGDQAKLDAWFKDNFADPIAAAAQGSTPGGAAIAPAKMQGYGATLVAEYIKGLTNTEMSGLAQLTKQIGETFENGFKDAAGKEDAQKLAAAQFTIAQALKEVAQDGQISETTLYRLSTIFGKNADDVARLVVEYGRMGTAQEHATATTAALAQATQNLAGVQAQAKNAAADADKAIAGAQATAKQHADDSTAAIEAQQDALKGVGDAAGEAARQSQAALDGLQATAQAHAEANQRAIADAQAALTAATEQRRRDSEIAQAAINGTTEAYERQNDALTEQDRKLAAHYETIIGGERRAKDAADERVNGLNRAANKEDLSFLTRIQQARESGHAKEANALQRQFDARKKQRSGEMEIARAQAAVAGDEYDAKAEQIKKEQAGRDEIDARAETEAGKRLKEVQDHADAQAKADAAAIKAVEDAAKAEADRYAAQQRGIQAEIDRLNDAAKAQASKDAAALTALQNQKTETALRWSIEEQGAKVALSLGQQIATANERIAKAAKDTYDADVARLPYAQAIAKAAQDEANARQVPTGNGATGGGRDSRVTPEDVSGAPLAGPPSQPGGPPNLPPLLEGKPGYAPPAGYHTELENTGLMWWVPDGHTLGEYGKQVASSGSTASQPGGSDSLGRSGSDAFLREAGTPATASAGGGDIHLHINAPNLTDIGDPAQQRAFAAQSGAALRYWRDKERGGPPQGVA